VRQGPSLLRGRLVSGDARSAQQARCRPIRAAGGDASFAVKAQQSALLEDRRRLFNAPPPGERLLTARPVDQQGGRLEVRQVRASATLADARRAAGWEATGRGREGATTVRWPAHPTRPVRHPVRAFLTRLSVPTPAAAAVRATRRPWPIEHRLPWPRAVTLGEDACQVRSGPAPQALAAVRNLVVGLLRRHGGSNLAAALRTTAWAGPTMVLGLLGLKL
jgi:hypothetical protein